MFNLETKFETQADMVISERVKTGKKDDAGEDIMENKPVATVKLPCPILSDFGIKAEQKIEKDAPVFKDSVPIYTDEVCNWLQSAIFNAVKAESRNLFVKGVLKEGVTLSSTFAELIEPAERTGEAMKARYDAKKSFAAYLESIGKSAVVVKALSDLFHNTESIVTARDNVVDAVVFHLPNWIKALNQTDAGRFERKVQSLQEALESRNVALDDMK